MTFWEMQDWKVWKKVGLKVVLKAKLKVELKVVSKRKIISPAKCWLMD